MKSSTSPEPSDATLKTTSPERSFAAGRYLARRVLGEGGQKTVYLVHDEALDRECALAILKTDALEGDGLERLNREARAMARLGAQPNIVTIFDIGSQEDGRPYLISEYVAGGDLRRAIRDASGAFPLERAIAIVADVAKGLAVAHQSGVVHRDIKPGNVWLTLAGTAKLGDFGLAAALDRSRLTMTGSVMGTASYMAPEQALGGEVDARSDLYALGAVFYELVTGRPPFLGDDVLAVISQHINVAAVAPSWHNASVTRPIEELILRLLAKSPDDRPASASVVCDELRRISSEPADSSPMVEAPGRELRGISWGRFVGRQEEMEELKEAFERSRSGSGVFVMIGGEPGIGKTRLCDEFGVYARVRGAQLLRGRCYEGDASVPYQPFIDAFRQFVRTRPDPPLRNELGEGAPAIATLVSEVRRRFPDLPEASPLDGEAYRLRLFESVVQFIGNAAQTAPVVLVLDDLQWADKASLLLLRHLVPEIASQNVLVIGVYRDIELDRTHPLADAISTLRRERNYQRILLRGISEDTVVDLLVSLSESDDDPTARAALAAALYQESEGNPFFIREILSHLIEERKLYRRDGRWTSSSAGITDLGIPEGVREVIGRRLSRLSDGCNRMLTLASAMHGGFTWAALTAVSDEEEGTLLDLLDEALGAQLVYESKTDQAGTYDFTHALVRQVLYDELSGPRRVLLHRRMGLALERFYAANLTPHLTELAHHFFLAAPGGDADTAIDYAVRAGERAVAVVAYEEAVAHYERALQVVDLKPDVESARRCDLLLRLAEARNKAGEPKRAFEHLLEAVNLARQLGDAERLGQVALGLGTFWTGAGLGRHPVVDVLDEALEALPREDSALRARLMACLARAIMFTPRFAEVPGLAGAAVEMARRVGDRRALANALDNQHAALGDPELLGQRLAAASELVAIGEELGDREMTAQGRCWRIVDLLAFGDMEAVDLEIPAVVSLNDEIKLPLFFWYYELINAMRAILEGRFADAELLTQRVLAAGQRVEGREGVQLYGVQLLTLRWNQGRLDEMGTLVEALRLQAASATVQVVPSVLAFLQVELEKLDEARETFESLAKADFADLPRDTTWLVAMSMLGHVAATLGDEQRARALYELLLPYGHLHVLAAEAVISVGAASRYLGLLATALRDWSAAERHFEHALEFNAHLGSPPFVAHTQRDYAMMLLQRAGPGDASRATELLRAAAETADALGMANLKQGASSALATIQAGRTDSK